MAIVYTKLTDEQLQKYSWLHSFPRIDENRQDQDRDYQYFDCKTIPAFQHQRLRKLSKEKRQSFLYDLERLFVEIGVIIYSARCVPSNEKVKDKLESLDGHVGKIFAQLDMTMVGVLMANANKDEANKVLEFRDLLILIRSLTRRSLKLKTFKASAADIDDLITLQTYHLLIKYDIKPTLTKAGAWEKLIKYLAEHHSLKLPAELKNSMRRVSGRCKTTEK